MCIKDVAKTSTIAIVLDNLDRKVKNVLLHKTLPVLLCRTVPEGVEQLDTRRKNIEEVLSNYTMESLLLDSPCNTEEKEAFMKV